MTEQLIGAAIVAAGIGLAIYGLERLRQRDRQIVLDNKCPPHKWEWVEDKNGAMEREEDRKRGGHVCQKCKRKAGQLAGISNNHTGPLAF